MNSRMLSNKRANFALQEVLALFEKQDADQKKDFKNFVAGAPAMIQQNGFGQALAFWLAKDQGKGDTKYRRLFNMVVKWLSLKKDDVNNNIISTEAPQENYRTVMDELSGMDQRKYLDAQKEAMAVLEWIKRFAHAYAPKEES